MENEGMTVGADNTNDIRGKHSLMRRHLQYTDQCYVLKKGCLKIYTMASYLYKYIYIYVYTHTHTYTYYFYLEFLQTSTHQFVDD